MTRAPLALALALSALGPSTALAHPLVDEARSAYHSARHERALELLDQAEEGTDLTREDLGELLLLRAMVHRAQRDMDLAEVDLLRLAGLDPERELGREVHPSLRRLFATVRERVPRAVRLDVNAVRQGQTVRIEVAVVDDVAALTQGFRVHGRVMGSPWRDTTDSRLVVDAFPSDVVEYWAEAVGPGGAPVASHGSPTDPMRVEAEAASGGGGGDPIGDVGTGGAVGSGSGGSEGGTDEGVPAWPFVVGGVVAVVAVGVILGVFFGTQPTDDTEISGIQVRSLVESHPFLLRFDL